MEPRHVQRNSGEEEQAVPDPWKEDESVSRSADTLLFRPLQEDSTSSSSTDGFLLDYDFILHPCLFLSCDYTADEYNVSTSPFAGSSYYAEEKDSPSRSSLDVWKLASLGTVTGLISLVTIIGNLIVILSFILERSIRQTSNYFIASLAVSDLLIGCISMPLYTVYLLSDQTWLLGETLCDLWLSLDYTLCLCSIYTVFCITIDRYCSVTLPAKYRKWRTERKVVGIVAVTWVVPVFVFFPSIMGWQYLSEAGRTVPTDKCYVQYMENALFNCLLQIGYFWATLVVMCALYAGIYRVALRLHRKAESRRRRMVSLVSVAGETITRIGIGMTGSAAAARRGISIPMLPLGGGGSGRGGVTVVSNRMGTTTTTILGRPMVESNDDDDDDFDDDDDDEKRSSGLGSGLSVPPETTSKGVEKCWKRPGDGGVPQASDIVQPSKRKSLTTMTRNFPGKKTSSFLGSRVFAERAENQYMLLPTEDVLERKPGEKGKVEDMEKEEEIGDGSRNSVGTSRNGDAMGGEDERGIGDGGKRVIIGEIRAVDRVSTGHAADSLCCSLNSAKRNVGCKSLGRGIQQQQQQQQQQQSTVNHPSVDVESGKSATNTKDKQLISSSNSIVAHTTDSRLLRQNISRPDQRRRFGFEKRWTGGGDGPSDLSFGRRRTNETVQQVVVTRKKKEEEEEDKEERGGNGREEEGKADEKRGCSGCYLAVRHQLGRQHLSPRSSVNEERRGGVCDSSKEVDCSSCNRRLSNGNCGGRIDLTESVVQDEGTAAQSRCLPIAEELPPTDLDKSSKTLVRNELNDKGHGTTMSQSTDEQDVHGSSTSALNNVSSGGSTTLGDASSDPTPRRQMVVSSRNHVNPSDAWKGGRATCTTRCLPRDQVTLQRVPTSASCAAAPLGRGRWRFSVLRQWSSRKQRSSRFLSQTSSSSSCSSQKTKHENHARKSVRTITLILGAFVVCWTPWHVLSLIMGFCSADPDLGGGSCVPPLLYDISYWLCYVNSPLNPFCYAFANQQFKKAFLRILKLDWRRN